MPQFKLTYGAFRYYSNELRKTEKKFNSIKSLNQFVRRLDEESKVEKKEILTNERWQKFIVFEGAIIYEDLLKDLKKQLTL